MKKILASLVLAILIIGLVASAALAETVYTHGSVNLRKKASIEAAIVKTLKDDTELKVLDTAQDNRGVKWYKVKVSGKTGWVSSVYVNDDEDEDNVKGYLIATGNVNLRNNPNGKILKTITKGAKVAYFKTKTVNGLKWILVRYNGTIGWACASYFSKDGGKTTKHYVYAVEGDSYIRAKANLNGKILKVLAEGDKAEYLNESAKDGRGVTWYKVKYNGTTGWVSSAYTVKK